MSKQYSVRSTDLTWRPVDDDIIVLDLRSSSYLALNGSATLLWRTLADGSTRENLAKELVQHFGLDETTAERDAADFLDDCIRRGLVQ